MDKEHARAGESKTASKTSTQDKKSASQRGGERSHRGVQGPTKDQLYAEAKKREVEGRSSMNKQELVKAQGHDRTSLQADGLANRDFGTR